MEDISEKSGWWCGEIWVFHRRTPKARKPHICTRCCEVIEKGTRYVEEVTAGTEGPGMETWRLHGECYLERKKFQYNDDGKRPAWRWE